MRKLIVAGLAVAMLLAGCTKGAKPPAPSDMPPASETPAGGEKPDTTPIKGTCVAPPTDRVPAASLWPMTGKVAVEGLCEALTWSDAFAVTFTLPPNADEAAVKAAVKVEGATADRITVVPGQAYVNVGAGKPGDVVTVRLAGPVGPSGATVDVGYRVTRKATPTVSAEVRAADGTWTPLASASTLPRAALTIRFLLKGSPNQQAIMEQIRSALAPRKDDAYALTYQLDADGPDRILLTIPSPPPKLEFSINNALDPDGISMRSFNLALYTGEKPKLVAFDPATGAEKELGEAPVDVLGSSASPDGKWVLVQALPPDVNYGASAWLLDTATGAMRQTKLSGGSAYYWMSDRLIVPLYGNVQVMDLSSLAVTESKSAAEYFSAISPDMRLLAGFSQDQRREEPSTFRAPTTIVVHDWQTGKDETYKDVAWSYVHHSESPPTLPMVFSCDGTKLSWQEDANSGSGHWRTLDRQTGKVTDEPAGKQVGCAPAAPTKGNGWQVEQPQSWGPITLISPDGRRVNAGSGRMLGWQPDGKALIIRWPNGQYARQPGI